MSRMTLMWFGGDGSVVGETETGHRETKGGKEELWRLENATLEIPRNEKKLQD